MAVAWLNPASSSSASPAVTSSALGRQVRSLRRVEHAGRGRHGRRHRLGAAEPAIPARGPYNRADLAGGEIEDAPRIASGIAELDDRASRRRLRAGIGHPRWRRSRHRQVDALDAGGGGSCREGQSRRLCLRRRGGGAGQAARAAPRRCRCPRSNSPPRPMSRTFWPRWPTASGRTS